MARADILVVGGGVFGLWVARRAAAAGLNVLLTEARQIGAGASGGVLGALTAHTPDRWTEKKAFQLAALLSLPGEIAALEEESGISAGYRRCGRIMPIRTPAFAAQVAERSAGAVAHWAAYDPSLVYEARPADDFDLAGWLDAAAAAPEGVVWDSLAGLLSPRGYLTALRAALERSGRVEIREGVAYLGADGDGGARLSDGSTLAVSATVLAAGFEAFDLHPALGALAAPSGGVKGRAALFHLPFDRPLHPPGRSTDLALPLLYEDGIYVAPHARSTAPIGVASVAVGSTDEKDWRSEDRPAFEAAQDVNDPAHPRDMAFLERAAALCPALRGRKPVEIWAGVRPKARSRDPLIGPLDDAARLWVAGGGFKIGLGVAHRVAAALIDRLTGREDAVSAPPRFWTDGTAAARKG
ncbi:MAG: FAD-binding oxidoreductase [Pseudomonadota bacterium]